jgi:four helix bundle protein
LKPESLETEDPKRELRRRTKEFAGLVIRLFLALDKRREELRVLGKQMIRSGTSVAANYREASRTRSNDEFTAKIDLCCQEADETQLWLELLRDECQVASSLIDPIWKEADELISIFVTMSKNTKRK